MYEFFIFFIYYKICLQVYLKCEKIMNFRKKRNIYGLMD